MRLFSCNMKIIENIYLLDMQCVLKVYLYIMYTI
jgi:hypothetical protein